MTIVNNTCEENLEKRFSFGENWQDYAQCINEERIQEAVISLKRLIPLQDYSDKTFLDIGSGSGLFSLAAIRLGFAKVMAIDIDPKSVKTTRSVLTHYTAGKNWQCEELNILDSDKKLLGTFDVVYSWGVLHHTGDMYKAIRNAADLVKPEGLFILALYRKTLMCGFWKWEKRIYNNGPDWFKGFSKTIYKFLFILRLLILFKNPYTYIKQYKQRRGMDWHYDVIDWIGGYPYESISPIELNHYANALGFKLKQSWTHKQLFGFLGAGCDEYCLIKNISP